MSGCCFNQVESQPGTNLQPAERLLAHMGFIMGPGKISQKQLFSRSLAAKLDYFLFLHLFYAETEKNQRAFEPKAPRNIV